MFPHSQETSKADHWPGVLPGCLTLAASPPGRHVPLAPETAFLVLSPPRHQVGAALCHTVSVLPALGDATPPCYKPCAVRAQERRGQIVFTRKIKLSFILIFKIRKQTNFQKSRGSL